MPKMKKFLPAITEIWVWTDTLTDAWTHGHTQDQLLDLPLVIGSVVNNQCVASLSFTHNTIAFHCNNIAFHHNTIAFHQNTIAFHHNTIVFPSNTIAFPRNNIVFPRNPRNSRSFKDFHEQWEPCIIILDL